MEGVAVRLAAMSAALVLAGAAPASAQDLSRLGLPSELVAPLGNVLDTLAAGPQVAGIQLPAVPVVGKPADLVVTAADPSATVDSVRAYFGERGGSVGLSACHVLAGRQPAPADSAEQTFTLPYVFRAPGPHTVQVEVVAGACSGHPRVTTQTLTVDVARGGGLRGASARAAGDRQVVEQARCANADVMPTRETRTATRKATACLLNAVRVRAGARRLVTDRRLRRIAAAHARDMVIRRYFDHDGPDGPRFVTRLRRIRWRGPAGENLGYAAYPLMTPRALVYAWMGSTGHRRNALDPRYRRIGVAIALGVPRGAGPGATYTADFGG